VPGLRIDEAIERAAIGRRRREPWPFGHGAKPFRGLGRYPQAAAHAARIGERGADGMQAMKAQAAGRRDGALCAPMFVPMSLESLVFPRPAGAALTRPEWPRPPVSVLAFIHDLA
jgi:hypothetical protein